MTFLENKRSGYYRAEVIRYSPLLLCCKELGPLKAGPDHSLLCTWVPLLPAHQGPRLRNRTSSRRPLTGFRHDSEPSTSDSRSSPTLFLSSEEPGPCTATQPVSPVSPCKPAPSPPGLPVPAGCSPPAPITGLGLGVTSSPDATPRAPGNENPEKDPGVQDPFLGPNVGDLLAELRTMNSHLGVIARALTKLASALGPQPPVDTQDAN
ncbi:uncharacterized protein Rv2082-like [Fukomys damarensis]|uniref:uncharacterized protein Rv2082-like n=1 Tax=Fukomys damarensis TaxID=885580 RepID=UPI001455BAAA|nr:uncharacterized protein Rv2082-like [Fukomys damarensis]